MFTFKAITSIEDFYVSERLLKEDESLEVVLYAFETTLNDQTLEKQVVAEIESAWIEIFGPEPLEEDGSDDWSSGFTLTLDFDGEQLLGVFKRFDHSSRSLMKAEVFFDDELALPKDFIEAVQAQFLGLFARFLAKVNNEFSE